MGIIGLVRARARMYRRQRERRRSSRFATWHLTTLSLGNRVITVEVLNVSEGGLCLRSSEPLPRLSRIHLCYPGGRVVQEIAIVNTRQQGQLHTSGARFLLSRAQGYVGFTKALRQAA